MASAVCKTPSTRRNYLVTTAKVISNTDCTQGARSKCSCVVCKEEHDLLYCNRFKTMPVNEFIEVANRNKLCFNCLKPSHTYSRCRLERMCSVVGRGKKHTKFLHRLPGTSDQKLRLLRTSGTDIHHRSECRKQWAYKS